MEPTTLEGLTQALDAVGDVTVNTAIAHVSTAMAWALGSQARDISQTLRSHWLLLGTTAVGAAYTWLSYDLAEVTRPHAYIGAMVAGACVGGIVGLLDRIATRDGPPGSRDNAPLLMGVGAVTGSAIYALLEIFAS